MSSSATVSPVSVESPTRMRLSHTSSVVYRVLGERSQTAQYQWQRRAARISQCFYCCCCDPHGLSAANKSCFTSCKAFSVKCISNSTSLCVTGICTVATCGIFLCCCECSEPPRQRMGVVHMVEVLPADDN